MYNKNTLSHTTQRTKHRRRAATAGQAAGARCPVPGAAQRGTGPGRGPHSLTESCSPRPSSCVAVSMCSAARGQGTKLALWLPAQGPPSPTVAFTGPALEPHSAAASWCSEQARLGSLGKKAAVRPGHHGSGSVPSHPGVSAPQGSTGCEPRTSPLHLLGSPGLAEGRCSTHVSASVF